MIGKSYFPDVLVLALGLRAQGAEISGYSAVPLITSWVTFQPIVPAFLLDKLQGKWAEGGLWSPFQWPTALTGSSPSIPAGAPPNLCG